MGLFSKKKLDVLKYESLKNVSITDVKEKYFDHILEFEETIVLVKLVKFYIKSELIVTNKYFWCINDNPKSYNRSKKPVLVSGVKEFYNHQRDTNKIVIKLGIIYPDCHNKTMYLNECDVVKITPKTNCYGFNIITENEIEEYFSQIK